MTFAHWVVAVGAVLLVISLLLITFRLRFTGYRSVSSIDNGTVTWTSPSRNEQGELTLLSIAGLAGVLGIGMILIGLARWPEK